MESNTLHIEDTSTEEIAGKNVLLWRDFNEDNKRTLHIQSLDQFLEMAMSAYDKSHNKDHGHMVWAISLIIAKTPQYINRNIDETVLEFAAKLHDARDDKYKDIKQVSYGEFKIFLCNHLGLSKAEDVITIIDNISYSKEIKGKCDNVPKHLLDYVTIIRDADRIETIGIVGIKRCIEYTLFRKGKVPEDVVQHCFDKLLKLYKNNYIRSKKGRDIARNLHYDIVKYVCENYTFRLKDIYHIFPGLNIEGTMPYYDSFINRANMSIGTVDKFDNYKKWVNIVQVLDTPLLGDRRLFSNILKDFNSNDYVILESTIDSINEHQLIALYTTIIIYYIKNEVNKKNGNSRSILVHVHQDGVTTQLDMILRAYVDQYLKDNNMRAVVSYTTDQGFYNTDDYISHYNEYNIIMSLSQCAGFDPSLPAGSFIIPSCAIPFDVNANTIDITYNAINQIADNDLVNTIGDILDTPNLYNQCIDMVNKHYISANIRKKDDAKKHTKVRYNDISFSDILKVNKLWNPTTDDSIVTFKF